jgi:hypothetical protein
MATTGTVPKFTITWHDTRVQIKTKRRNASFKSLQSLLVTVTWILDTMPWRLNVFPTLCVEQEEDGLLDAFRYLKYGRKKTALNHLRMVGKLLVWHKHSVEKLWDPSNPANHERIFSVD